MGYGPITPGGVQKPITPWQGSWAQQEQAKRQANKSANPPANHGTRY